MDLGRRLRDLRKSRSMSLYDVERLTGRHFSTIGKYERGERRPDLQTLRELAAVYETTVADILGEKPASSAHADLADLASAARHLSPEQLAALVQFLRSLAPEAQEDGQ